MSEVTQTQEEESNPYNMNKPWHTPDCEKVNTADQLFFEKPKKATQNTAPEEDGEEEKTPKKTMTGEPVTKVEVDPKISDK